jgi:RNA polymerase sigma-70 factor (ECF subfamily)
MADTPVSLLQRLQKSPVPEDWSELLDLYTEPLFRYALSRWLSTEDARDLVQQVFVVLVERLPTFEYDPRRSFTAWLLTVARNKITDFHRQARRPLHLSLAPDDAPAEEDSWTEREFTEHVVRTAFARLQAEFDEKTVTGCRECWMLGRPVAEVAGELGLTANALQCRLMRARKRLSQQLLDLVE